MPFKSEAQRRYFYSELPELAERWQDHTPPGEKLPERVAPKKKDKTMLNKKEAVALGNQDALETFGVKAAALDLWNPTTGQVIGGMGAAANRNVAVQAPVSGQAPAKPKFDLNALRAAYAKAGVKPGLTSAVHGKVAALAQYGLKEANALATGANLLGKGLQLGGAVAGEVPIVGQAAGAAIGGIGGALSGAATAAPGHALRGALIGGTSGAVEGGIGGFTGAAAGAAANAGLHKAFA